MKEPLLSIIVPAYNAERTIEKCLKSIQSQVFTDFECIVIVDGGADATEAICKDVALNDSRFNVFINKNNKGIAFCRNFGIQKIKGKLVGWVDSDDYIDLDHFADLCRPMMENTNIDISMCNLAITKNGRDVGFFDVYKSICKFDPDAINTNTTTSQFALLALCEDEHCKSWLCNKVFRRNLFENIDFPCQLNVLEDFSVMHSIFCSARSIYLTGVATYHNEQTENSLSRPLLVSEFWKWLIPASDRYFFVKQRNSKAAELALETYFRFLNMALSNSLFENQRTPPDFIKPTLKRMLPDIIFSTSLSMKSKIKYILLTSWLSVFYRFLKKS